MASENPEVSSELYAEFNYETNGKPIVSEHNTVSRFPFKYPPNRSIEVDSDGDLVVQRKSQVKDSSSGTIEIEHSKSTVLSLVGLQVWRGAFLLADWLLHNGHELCKHGTILELGSGTGLTSIVAAMYTPVVCTDVNKGNILKLIESNVDRNKSLTKQSVLVTEIDFTKGSFGPEVTAALGEVEIVLAADVVYDNELTEAFVDTVKLLFTYPSVRSVYVALEKRYVFTIADCDVVAPCYEFFLECLDRLTNVMATEVPLDFPRYFSYDRTKELVLWRITNSIK